MQGNLDHRNKTHKPKKKIEINKQVFILPYKTKVKRFWQVKKKWSGISNLAKKTDRKINCNFDL